MPFELIQLLSQTPLTTLVPAWFYIFSGLAYILVGAISIFISYFSFKLFNITSLKPHFLLTLSFLLIGIAFGIISITSFYTYQNSESLDKTIFNLNTNAYNIYYLLSLIAYLFLVMINLPKKDVRMYAFVPVWFIGSPGFHSVALMFLIYISIKSVLNFFKIKSEESFLVMFAFLTITLFHVFVFLMPFGIELYLVAHAFLVVGFLSLLIMLIRVTRK